MQQWAEGLSDEKFQKFYTNKTCREGKSVPATSSPTATTPAPTTKATLTCDKIRKTLKAVNKGLDEIEVDGQKIEELKKAYNQKMAKLNLFKSMPT